MPRSLLQTTREAAEDTLFALVQQAGLLAAGLKLKSVEVAPGCPMYYYDSGPDAGRDTLVLVHGFNADKSHWTLMAAHLRPYRLIIPDLGGHGQSWYDPGLTYDIPYQARLLRQLLSALDIRQFHLAGNSMGGWVSAHLAATDPDGIRSLSLLNAAGVSAPVASPFFQTLDRGRNLFFYEDATGFHELMQLAVETPLPDVKPVLNAQIRQGVARLPLARKLFADITDARQVRFAPEQGLDERLAKIDAPTLVLWGRQDRIIDVSTAETFAQRLKRHEVVIMDGVGHVPMLERPRHTARIVGRFVARHR